MKKFLITTPIYYPNGYPHIGHAYSSFIADVYARFKRIFWYQVKFSTGNDENSQKILQQAKLEWKNVHDYLDMMAKKRKEVWNELMISYTDFIRTTQDDHKQLVQSMLQKSYDKWDIYEWMYQWYYCVWCEWFKTEKDLIEKDGKLVCPDHLTSPEYISEKNWFFKLRNYQDTIQTFYQQHPTFVIPDYRFNEMKSFVAHGLEDFSISRETNTFGIPLPFDPQQVTYVRYDALFNYVTVSEADWFWDDSTEIIHILGKDITRFHAIFWPAMLMSVGYRLPSKELITWYFTVNGHKISKSLGNVIDPVTLVHRYDRDALVFTLLYDVTIGADGDFSETRLSDLYESMLIGSWGNLVNRVVSLSKKYGITKGKYFSQKWKMYIGDDTNPLFALFEHGRDTNLVETTYLNTADLKWYLNDRYQLVQKANEYITKTAPRNTYKHQDTQWEAISDLQFLLYIVKNLALLSAPILINGFTKIKEIFGNNILMYIDTTTSLDEHTYKLAFDMDEFDVQLTPNLLYQKTNSSV